MNDFYFEIDLTGLNPSLNDDTLSIRSVRDSDFEDAAQTIRSALKNVPTLKTSDIEGLICDLHQTIIARIIASRVIL